MRPARNGMVGRATRAGLGWVASCVAALAGVVASCGEAPAQGTGARAAPAASVPESSAGAGQAQAEDIAAARRLSRAFQGVARQVEPAVVHIVSKRREPETVSDGFFWRRTGRMILRQAGVGSGVIVSPDGLIVTNNHVVAGADALTVRLRDGRELDGTVVGRDPLTDVAVVRVGASGLTPAAWTDSDQVEVGEWVVAIGSPFGFASTVTSGIISAKGRSGIGLPGQDESAYQDFIQTDAAINPGNSGGPLLNLEGKIVGINSAIASRAGGSEGIGFAIPSNMARAVMDSIVKNGRVTRGFLGVALAEVGPREADALGLQPRAGVLVTRVEPDGPADKAGIRDNDVIASFQGRPVSQVSSLRAAIATTTPGSPAKIELLREGKPVEIALSVGDQGEYLSSRAEQLGGVYLRDVGLTAKTLTEQDARGLGLQRGSGALIVNIDPDGPAARATPKLQEQDIVVGVGDARIRGADDLRRVLGEKGVREGVRLMVYRPSTDQRGYVDIRE